MGVFSDGSHGVTNPPGIAAVCPYRARSSHVHAVQGWASILALEPQRFSLPSILNHDRGEFVQLF